MFKIEEKRVDKFYYLLVKKKSSEPKYLQALKLLFSGSIYNFTIKCKKGAKKLFDQLNNRHNQKTMQKTSTIR